jgi:ParB family chromosome partitioning protein
LLTVDDTKRQRDLAKETIDGGWSVRELERKTKNPSSSQNTDTKGVSRHIDANVKAAETKLMRALNTNVKIVPAKKGTGGKVEIEYYGVDDLDRIFQQLVKKENA